MHELCMLLGKAGLEGPCDFLLQPHGLHLVPSRWLPPFKDFSLVLHKHPLPMGFCQEPSSIDPAVHTILIACLQPNMVMDIVRVCQWHPGKLNRLSNDQSLKAVCKWHAKIALTKRSRHVLQQPYTAVSWKSRFPISHSTVLPQDALEAL